MSSITLPSRTSGRCMRPMTPDSAMLRWELAQMGLHTHDLEIIFQCPEQTQSGGSPRDRQFFSLQCPTGSGKKVLGPPLLHAVSSVLERKHCINKNIRKPMLFYFTVDNKHTCTFLDLSFFFFF